ncbi:proline dehydrogenase family protein [Cohnella faecalis]|uniref:proline dehydrogenase n=1 Tax=Cohnella faecalis TaxID=2315694 RepID=A0A398CN70_9BACL|nr:proline dehydrogenase family protein [Cohnella faecalis]RIE01357.1 proline dehydrogenase [Cohnella faecalis]
MDRVTRMFRSALLAMAGNRVAESIASRCGLKLGAGRFVAGETMEQALDQARKLNEKGIMATLDHLGEGIRDLTEAQRYKEEVLRLLDGIEASGVDANVSIKPTQMGLALNEEAGYAHIREIVSKAKTLRNFVRLDMENSPYTSATIETVRRLRAEGLSNTGTVIQAYLRRSEWDLRRITAEKMNVRLVKGAYKEPGAIAYPDMKDVDDSFKRLISARLRSGVYTAVATHDERMIEWTKFCASGFDVSPSSFEFQMLYGIRTPLQERLAREGFRIRCYVPYGRMWYPYFVRRLAERPANLLFITKSIFKR